MSDDEALLGQILTRPDEDLPRLIYADYLEETGDRTLLARAEFIRLQMALLRDEHLTSQERTQLLIREKLLLNKFAKEWVAPFQKKGEPLASTRCHGLYRRGFIETVWMPAGWFIWKAKKLFTRLPIRELRLTLVSVPEFAEVVQIAEFQKLSALDLSDRRIGLEAIFELHRCPSLDHLKVLRLRACNITNTVADLLVDFGPDFQPELLDLSLNPLNELSLKQLQRRYGAALKYDE